jgi:Flp pilus assembly protein TadD
MLDETRQQILEHLQHRRFGQAQYHLRRLVQEDGQDAATRSLLALCLAELEQYDEAVEHAWHAVRLAPDEPYCAWALAVVLAARREFKVALPTRGALSTWRRTMRISGGCLPGVTPVSESGRSR